MRLVWGIIGILVGFGLIKYAVQIVSMFGKIGWAEEHLRGGFAGTYTLYKLIGLTFIVLSFLYMVGAFNWFDLPSVPQP